VLQGVNKVFIEVEDQDRGLEFWTEKMGFQVTEDTEYGAERWIELQTPDGATFVVLDLRKGERPEAPEGLPTSNVAFYCDDLGATYDELAARGVSFPQPPVQQPFGWWSLFEDTEGNRFALTPSE
jgi:lactoylglutathione lyase